MLSPSELVKVDAVDIDVVGREQLPGLRPDLVANLHKTDNLQSLGAQVFVHCSVWIFGIKNHVITVGFLYEGYV